MGHAGVVLVEDTLAVSSVVDMGEGLKNGEVLGQREALQGKEVAVSSSAHTGGKLQSPVRHSHSHGRGQQHYSVRLHLRKQKAPNRTNQNKKLKASSVVHFGRYKVICE